MNEQATGKQMVNQQDVKKPLAGCVAVVTGASRGGGRGIALELGAAGATVYVTGRSTAKVPAPGYDQILELSKLDDLPGSIDETALAVTGLGGTGIAVRCDHTHPDEVEDLFRRVREQAGQLDLLVNNAWVDTRVSTESSIRRFGSSRCLTGTPCLTEVYAIT
jgi:NAD(P)-dependent dehydrogenase (short-subunit alcohol dehydrogenase family)